MNKLALILFFLMSFIAGIDQAAANIPQDTITDGNYQLYPLGIACRKGDLTTVKKMLVTDDEPMAMGSECYEFDILYTAIYYNQEAILRYALTKYKNLNNRLYSDEYGLTLLTLACRLSNTKLSEILLEHGIDVDGYQNESDMYTVYPIMEAIENKNTELVWLLLKYGANTKVADNEGYTPLSLARELGLKEIENAIKAQK